MIFIPTVASVSLGNPAVHPIDRRLSAAAECGFKGVEIVEADILEQSKKLGGDDSPDGQLTAARSIRVMCDQLGLHVVVLQPFWFYEGLLDRKEHEARITKLHLWMRLASVLGTSMVQIPTNWLNEGTTGDINIIVADLLEMAEIGLKQDPPVRFAYEGVAWGTHIDTWEGTWDIIKRVNRPNFGMCLDTYHVAARVWADPASESGRNEDGDEALRQSLERMSKQLPVQKIFYVQPGDAEKLDTPIIHGHAYFNAEQKPRMSWSRNARLFAYEEERGGCLPIEQIMDTLVAKMGYRGLISAESFSRHLFDPRPDVPTEYASRAARSWERMLQEWEGKIDL